MELHLPVADLLSDKEESKASKSAATPQRVKTPLDSPYLPNHPWLFDLMNATS